MWGEVAMCVCVLTVCYNFVCVHVFLFFVIWNAKVTMSEIWAHPQKIKKKIHVPTWGIEFLLYKWPPASFYLKTIRFIIISNLFSLLALCNVWGQPVGVSKTSDWRIKVKLGWWGLSLLFIFKNPSMYNYVWEHLFWDWTEMKQLLRLFKWS